MFSGEKNVTIIPITGDEVDVLLSKYPYYAKTIIPKNTYAELDKDIETIAVKATLTTTSEMPDNVVYFICEQIFANLNSFKAMHAAYASLTKEAMIEGLTAPLHPGALQYFQEIELTSYQILKIGTGNISGIYYPTGANIAQLINQNSNKHNIYLKSEQSAGSVYNINAIVAGEIDFGLAQSDRQYQATMGEAEWAEAGPQEKLAGMFTLYPESVTLIASDASEIHSVFDLIGKRVNLGNKGSGPLQNSLDALNALGINPKDDILPFYETVDKAILMFKGGQIDAFFYTVGHPSTIVKDILNNEIMPAHLVSIKGYGLQKMVDQKPYYSMTTITSEMYPDEDISESIETFGVKATLLTSVDIPENIVYQITHDLFENLLDFKKLHPAYQNITKHSMLEGSTAPIHPGAMKYFKEVGLQ